MANVALVSGGASGLGRATVEKLAASKMRVVIADRDAEGGEALAKELGDAARFVSVDVADAAQVKAAVEVATGMGSFRVAVSCAGIGRAARTVDKDGQAHDLDLFQKTI